MQHRRCSAGFASKSLSCRTAAGQIRSHDFDRHGSIQRPIVTFQNNFHPAGANDARHFVATKPTEHLRIIGGIQKLQHLTNMLSASNRFIRSHRRCRRRNAAVRQHVAIKIVAAQKCCGLRPDSFCRRLFFHASSTAFTFLQMSQGAGFFDSGKLGVQKRVDVQCSTVRCFCVHVSDSSISFTAACSRRMTRLRAACTLAMDVCMVAATISLDCPSTTAITKICHVSG